MSNGIVPRPGDRGTFNLKAPWVITQQGEYTCHALRSYTELAKNNIDVFKMFYLPKGISEETYRQDSAAGAVIVALRSSSGNFIYVPSTYILGVPNGNGYAYSQRIITLELGALPTDLSTEALRADISVMVNSRFGVDPIVAEAELPISEVVSPENHTTIEAGRRGRITESGNYESMYRELQTRYQELLSENQTMTNKLIELGVITL